MKAMQFSVLVVAMAYSTMGLADSSLDAAQFGRMKGILNACGRVNPQQASKYLLQIKALIGDASRETVDQAARTPEYQMAYQAVTEELGNMGQDEMTRACTGYLATAK